MRLGPRLRQTIRDITRASSPREVGAAIARFGEPTGLTRLFLAELVLGYTRPEMVVFIDTMGPEWRRVNAERRGLEIDPMIDFMRGQTGPVQWSEIERSAITQDQQRYLVSFRDIGFVDGVSVPIWGPNGYWAWAAATSDRAFTLTDSDRGAIQLIAMLALTRCRLLRHGVAAPGDHERTITHREADILYWVLEGKTDDEIGIIVGLGRATVKFHVRNAAEKLDAANRITAAVKALKAGLLLGPLTRHAVLVDGSRRGDRT